MSSQLGDQATGIVVDVKIFAVFLALGDGTRGFIDGAGMSDPWLRIPEPETWPRVGDTITGRIVSVREPATPSWRSSTTFAVEPTPTRFGS